MKNWKRIAVLVTSAMMVGATLAGCGSRGRTTEAAKGNEPRAEAGVQTGRDTGKAADNGEKKQVYVFTHDRGDLPYWDSMAVGSDRAVADYADKADVYMVETTADLQANLQAMYEATDKDTDLIITVSDSKDSLMKVANEHLDIVFTIINEDVINQCKSNNAYGVGFATSQAVFLDGIAAADVAANGAEGMDPINVTSFIDGTNESLVIQGFLWDYIQDAQYYDPDIEIIYNYIGAWNDPNATRTQTMTQYSDAGADVIFTCADGSGNGVHNAAEEAQKFVISAGNDQFQLYEDDKAIQERFLTPVAKEMGNAIYNVIGEYLDNGTPPYGEYEVLGLLDGAIGIMEGDQLNGALSDEGRAELEETKAGITDGSIEIKGAIDKRQDGVRAFINGSCQ